MVIIFFEIALLLSSRYRLSRHQCMQWAHKPLQSQWREGESACTYHCER